MPALDRRDEVHVRSRPLRLSPEALARSWATLSGDERQRADRHHFQRDRMDFVSARAWLRAVLSTYLDRPPGSVAFRYGPFEKPYLSGEMASDLQFSMAHSHGQALLAICRAFEIGADLELVRPIRDDVAGQFFSASEVAALRTLPEPERLDGFYRCWTRKEAYVKALGSGLNVPLSGFEMSLRPGEPARLLSVAADPEEAQSWQVEHLEPAAGYVGALAARRRGWSVAWIADAP